MPILDTPAEVREILDTSKTIAVVGLSDNPDRDSNTVSNFMRSKGYTIIPVNPMVDEVFGMKSYPDLASIPVPIDIVNIFRKPELVPAIVEEVIKVQAKCVWMQPGTVHEEAAQHASESGLSVVAGRCIRVEYNFVKR